MMILKLKLGRDGMRVLCAIFATFLQIKIIPKYKVHWKKINKNNHTTGNSIFKVPYVVTRSSIKCICKDLSSKGPCFEHTLYTTGRYQDINSISSINSSLSLIIKTKAFTKNGPELS